MSGLEAALRSACKESGWSYAALWKVNHAHGILSWEDAFTVDVAQPPHAGALLASSLSRMSFDIHRLGEGPLGRAALSGKHQWLFAPHPSRLALSNFPPSWPSQFAAGIKTVAVIPTAQGVLQLGSPRVIPESGKIVARFTLLLSSAEPFSKQKQPALIPGASLSDEASTIPPAPSIPRASTISPASTGSPAPTISPASSTTPASAPSPALPPHQGSGPALPGLTEIRLDFFPSQERARWGPASRSSTGQWKAAPTNAGSSAGASGAGTVPGLGRYGGSSLPLSQGRQGPASSSPLRSRLEGLQQARLRSRLQHHQVHHDQHENPPAEQQQQQAQYKQQQEQLKGEQHGSHQQPGQEQRLMTQDVPDTTRPSLCEVRGLQAPEAQRHNLKRASPDEAAPMPGCGTTWRADSAEGYSVGASPAGSVGEAAAGSAGKRLRQGVPPTVGVSACPLPRKPPRSPSSTAGAPRASPAGALEGVLAEATGLQEGPGSAVQGRCLSLQSLKELLTVEGETGKPAEGMLEHVSPRCAAGAYAGEAGKADASVPFESGLGDELTLEVLLSEALGSPTGGLGGPDAGFVSPSDALIQAQVAGEGLPLPRGKGMLDDQPTYTGAVLGSGGAFGVPGVDVHFTDGDRAQLLQEEIQLRGLDRLDRHGQGQGHTGGVPGAPLDELSRIPGQPGGMLAADTAFDELSHALGVGLTGLRGPSADVVAQLSGPHLPIPQASNSPAAGNTSTGQCSRTGAGVALQVSPSSARTPSQCGPSPALSGSEGRSLGQVATAGDGGALGGRVSRQALGEDSSLQGQGRQGAQDPLQAMEEMALQGALKLAAGLRLKRAQGSPGARTSVGPGPYDSSTPGARGSLVETPEEEKISPSSCGAPRASQGASTSPVGACTLTAAQAQRLASGPGSAFRDSLGGGFAAYVEALRGLEDPQALVDVQTQQTLQGLQELQGLRGLEGLQGYQGLESQISLEQARVYLQRQWQHQRDQRLLLHEHHEQQLQELQHQEGLLIEQQRDKQLLLHPEQQRHRLLGLTPECLSDVWATQRRPFSSLPGGPWSHDGNPHPQPHPHPPARLQDWSGARGLGADLSPLAASLNTHEDRPQGMQQAALDGRQQAEDALRALVGAPFSRRERPQRLPGHAPLEKHGLPGANPLGTSYSGGCFWDIQPSLAGADRGMGVVGSGLEGAGLRELPGLVGLERLGQPGVTAGAVSPQAGGGAVSSDANASPLWAKDVGPVAEAAPALLALERSARGAANATNGRFSDAIRWQEGLLEAALQRHTPVAPGPLAREPGLEEAEPGLHAVGAEAGVDMGAHRSSVVSQILNSRDSHVPLPAPCSSAALAATSRGLTGSAPSSGARAELLSATTQDPGRPFAHLLVAKPESLPPGSPCIPGHGADLSAARLGAEAMPAGGEKLLVPGASPSLVQEHMRAALQGLVPARPGAASGSDVPGLTGALSSASALAVEVGIREGRPLVDRHVASTMAASLTVSPALRRSQLASQVARSASPSSEALVHTPRVAGGNTADILAVGLRAGGPSAQGAPRAALSGSGGLQERGRSEGAGKKGPATASVAPLPTPGRGLTRRVDGKGRPRDRQLIQENLQALRDLLPGTSKVSIEMLLERVMQRIGFLREATRQQKLLLEAPPSDKRRETAPGEAGPVVVSRLSSSVLRIEVRLKLSRSVAAPVHLASLLSGLGLVVRKGRVAVHRRQSSSGSQPQPQPLLATFLIEAPETMECAEIALQVRAQLEEIC